MIVALFADQIASVAEGGGQEIFNATVLFVAVIMLAWHNIWMNSHGREMATTMKAIGAAVRAGSRPMYALAIVCGIAVLREGSEIVLFLYGIVSSGTNAAGMAAQGASFLVQANLLPALGSMMWNTSWRLTEGSILGKVLHTLVGYTVRPSGIQLAFYLVTLITILTLMKLFNRKPQAATRARPLRAGAEREGGQRHPRAEFDLTSTGSTPLMLQGKRSPHGEATTKARMSKKTVEPVSAKSAAPSLHVDAHFNGDQDCCGVDERDVGHVCFQLANGVELRCLLLRHTSLRHVSARMFTQPALRSESPGESRYDAHHAVRRIP